MTSAAVDGAPVERGSESGGVATISGRRRLVGICPSPRFEGPRFVEAADIKDEPSSPHWTVKEELVEEDEDGAVTAAGQEEFWPVEAANRSSSGGSVDDDWDPSRGPAGFGFWLTPTAAQRPTECSSPADFAQISTVAADDDGNSSSSSHEDIRVKDEPFEEEDDGQQVRSTEEYASVSSTDSPSSSGGSAASGQLNQVSAGRAIPYAVCRATVSRTPSPFGHQRRPAAVVIDCTGTNIRRRRPVIVDRGGDSGRTQRTRRLPRRFQDYVLFCEPTLKIYA